METVQLSNGVKMPMEGFGVFQIPEETCEQVVKDAIATGYRLIDTASSYQNEKAVGRAIRNCGVPREELFVTTKAYIQQMGYEKTKEAFAQSLDHLGLTYLDLYLIHMPFGDYYGSWRAFEELYQEGKVRAIGVCNFLPDRLLDLCYNAKILPQINQIERHPHYQRLEELSLMKEWKVQPQAWAPFAEGLKGMFTEPVLQEIALKHRPRLFYVGMCSRGLLSFQSPSTKSGWKKIWISGTLRWTVRRWSRSRLLIKAALPCWIPRRSAR